MKRLALLLVLVACKQSHHDAWQTICDAPKHVPSKDPSKVYQWIDKHVTNEQARKELEQLASFERDNDEIMREVVAEAGLDPKRCAILDN